MRVAVTTATRLQPSLRISIVRIWPPFRAGCRAKTNLLRTCTRGQVHTFDRSRDPPRHAARDRLEPCSEHCSPRVAANRGPPRPPSPPRSRPLPPSATPCSLRTPDCSSASPARAPSTASAPPSTPTSRPAWPPSPDDRRADLEPPPPPPRLHRSRSYPREIPSRADPPPTCPTRQPQRAVPTLRTDPPPTCPTGQPQRTIQICLVRALPVSSCHAASSTTPAAVSGA